MSDNGNIVAGGSSQSTAVTNLLLDVGDNRTFRYLTQRQDVTNAQRGVLSSVDKLSSVKALVCDECLGSLLEAVGIAEFYLGEWCASAGVVDDVLHDTSDISMSFTVVESSELGWSLVEAGVSGCKYEVSKSSNEKKSDNELKMLPRPFRWLRITRPIL